MRTQHRGLVFLALAALLIAALAAGCGGGGGNSGIPGPVGQIGKSGTGSGNGITATAAIAGNTVSITAHTDRSDIAQIWATVTGYSGQAILTGSGKDWSGGAQVNADANSIITIDVLARDSLGNQMGPARVQVRMGEFGTQSAITGVVLSREDGSPILGATVTLGEQATSTDSTGKFVFTGLVTGATLQGVVTKSGFSEARFTVTVTNETVNVGQIALQATQDLPPAAPTFP